MWHDEMLRCDATEYNDKITGFVFGVVVVVLNSDWWNLKKERVRWNLRIYYFFNSACLYFKSYLYLIEVELDCVYFYINIHVPNKGAETKWRLNKSVRVFLFFSCTLMVPKLSLCFRPGRWAQLFNWQTAAITHRWGDEGGRGEWSRKAEWQAHFEWMRNTVKGPLLGTKRDKTEEKERGIMRHKVSTEADRQ